MKKLIICLILLAGGVAPVMSQLPAPLDSANVVWQMGDFSDENGPPFVNLDEITGGEHGTSTGVDVSGDGIIAPNCDGLAAQNTNWLWKDFLSGSPASDDLWPVGSMTIFVRYKTPAFVVNEDIWAVQDTPCNYPFGPMYALEMTSGEPQFKVTGTGNAGSPDVVTLGQIVSTDTWYDYTGVFDATAGTITIYAYSPVTGQFVVSNSSSVSYTALESGVGTEISWWVAPCAERDEANNGAMM